MNVGDRSPQVRFRYLADAFSASFGRHCQSLCPDAFLSLSLMTAYILRHASSGLMFPSLTSRSSVHFAPMNHISASFPVVLSMTYVANGWVHDIPVDMSVLTRIHGCLPSESDLAGCCSQANARTRTPIFRRFSVYCIRPWTGSHTHRAHAIGVAFTGRSRNRTWKVPIRSRLSSPNIAYSHLLSVRPHVETTCERLTVISQSSKRKKVYVLTQLRSVQRASMGVAQRVWQRLCSSALIVFCRMHMHGRH